MQKIGNITSTATPAGEFTNGVVAQGIVPTNIDDKWLNTMQRELVKVVEGAGLTLNPADDTQVWQAIKLLANGQIEIAADADIVAGTVGKLIDAAGLLRRTDSGRQPPFNQSVCDAINGYPKGAILLSTDGQTLWKSTVDANTTDPDSASASGWQKVVTEKTLTDRFTIIYPNGGSAASPANITYRQRYVSPNPFPGHYVACQLECYFGSDWSLISFTQSATGSTNPGVGAVAGQVGDEIRIQTGGEGLFGSSQGTGNLFNSSTSSITTAPCRIKVWRID